MNYERSDFLEVFDKEFGYENQTGVISYVLSTNDGAKLQITIHVYEDFVRIILVMPNSKHVVLDFTITSVEFLKIKEIKKGFKVLCFFITDKDEHPALEIVIQPVIQLQHTMTLI